jgi:pimeloyl-ACP methyl ester carboxylesterase
MKFVVSIFLAVTLTQCSSGVAQESHLAPVETGAIESAHGCTVVYERYKPGRNAVSPEVILAHGFMRKLDNMRGWARHWQQQGIPTTLVSLCNSSWLNGHHQRNADDMQALRRELEMDAVIYAGFSAGGLAAYLAAGQDASAAGYLGLDSVDSGDLALSTASPLSVPAFFLTAEPSACNAQGNFKPIFERWSQYRVSHISGATHCHFEMPYDTRCGWICGRADAEATRQIQSTIREQATDWLKQLHHRRPHGAGMPLRTLPGDAPKTRLNARLNAASDW